ncbi:MAG: PEP-CTERM sorting domain-containing protein [Rubrivivax sp.]
MNAAQAVVVNVDFSGNPLSTVPFDINGVYIDVVTGALSAASFTGYDINPYFSGSGGATPAFRLFLPSTGGAVVAGGTIAASLVPGAVVDGSATFANGVINAHQASVPVTSYFGFRFINEQTSATNYGYLVVRQTANPAVAGSIRVLGYSYENAGAAITVTAVPEPSTLLMMLSGLVAAAGLRLRRRAALQQGG